MTSHTMPPGAVTLHDALDYRDRGIATIPVGLDKRPRLKGWKEFQSRPPSESRIRQWFGGDDQQAIAGIMGPVSGGLACRDYDAMPAYDAWAAENPKLASTLPTVATRRGRHVYFRAAAASSRFDDGDLQAAGCYCLLPPSEHSAGLYHWLVPFPSHVDQLPMIDILKSGFLPQALHRDSGDTDTQEILVSLCAVVCDDGGTPGDHASASDHVEFAIASTLPEKFGQRHRQLFEFARYLKSDPATAGLPLDQLKPLVRRWHTAALPRMRTKVFEETWIDFAHAFEGVKFAIGKEPIVQIAEQARADTSDLPKAARDFETPELVLLVRLCRELQRHHGEKPFYLDCRTAGRMLAVEHYQAARWLKHLCRVNILHLVARGNRGHASEYRYIAGDAM